MTTMSERVTDPRDLIPEGAATRVRVLIGDDDDIQLRKGRKAIAYSDCVFPGLSPEIAARCVQALRDSDERLREIHDNYMLWSWNSTWVEHNADGTINVLLGVAWYDLEFYNERKGAGFGRMHRLIYDEIGIKAEDVQIKHWLLDEAA